VYKYQKKIPKKHIYMYTSGIKTPVGLVQAGESINIYMYIRIYIYEYTSSIKTAVDLVQVYIYNKCVYVYIWIFLRDVCIHMYNSGIKTPMGLVQAGESAVTQILMDGMYM
jgi:hypothetical protein